MRHILNKNLLTVMLLLSAGASIFMSCNKDENGAAPVIDRVSLVAKDSTTDTGSRGNTYVIFGQNLASVQHVYFSGVEAALNTTTVRNDNIIVAVPNTAPFPGPSVLSTVRVVTLHGEAQSAFKIKQPVPSINNFVPAVAVPGDLVTITGSYFNNLQNVSFIDLKTGVATQAEVISQTTNGSDEIVVVKVPANTKVSYVGITTAAGFGKSVKTFGFNFAIFTDDIAPGFNKAGWGNIDVWDNSAVVKSGKFADKHSYLGGWSGFQITRDAGNEFQLAGYTALKVSVYGGPGTKGKLTQIYITMVPGGPATPFELAINEGVWTDYTVPLSAIGNPTQISELVIQDKGMAPYLIYVDDLGLL